MKVVGIYIIRLNDKAWGLSLKKRLPRKIGRDKIDNDNKKWAARRCPILGRYMYISL